MYVYFGSECEGEGNKKKMEKNTGRQYMFIIQLDEIEKKKIRH